MSEIRWFLWVFLVLATVDIVADSYLSLELSLRVQTARSRHRSFFTWVRFLLFLWASWLVCRVI